MNNIYKHFCLAAILLAWSVSAQAQNNVVNVSSAKATAGMFSKQNTTFRLTADVNLSGQTISLGQGSKIDVQGGSLKNGTLKMGNNSSIDGKKAKRKISQIKIQVVGKNVSISNFAWKTEKSVALLSYAECDNLRVENCQITANGNNCVKLVTDNISGIVENIVFSNCSFQFQRMGIELQNHKGSAYKFDGVQISNCNFATAPVKLKYGYAISLSGYGKNTSIVQNTFNKTSVGVEIVGFSDVAIKKNNFDNVTGKIIVASNSRKMTDIAITDNQADSKQARLQLSNCTKVMIQNNSFNISFIELQGSSNCTIQNNILTTNGHYAVMIDGTSKKAQNNVVSNNTVTQRGNNWSVFRCYGQYSTGNAFKNNSVKRTNSKGVKHDQMKGASGNTFK